MSWGTMPRFLGFWKMRGLEQMISEVSAMLHFLTCLAREFACNELHPPLSSHTLIQNFVFPVHFLIHSVSILYAYSVSDSVLGIRNKIGNRPEHHHILTLKGLLFNRETSK